MQIVQYSGSLRVSVRSALGVLTPVYPDPTDYFGNKPVQASAFTNTYEAGEERTLTSYNRPEDGGGQTIFSRKDPGVLRGSLTLQDVPGAVLAICFFGEGAKTNITGGSASDAEFEVTARDVPLKLPHRWLSDTPAPVVKSSDGLTTYDAGDDYVIHPRLGYITIKGDGDISNGATIKLSYSYASYELLSIPSGGKPETDLYLHGDMLNNADGNDGEFEAYQFRCQRSGDFNLWSLDPLTVTLEGTFLKPGDKPVALRFDRYNKTT
jgi:hypothetical protein